jgi:hypothetical protein
MDASTATLDGKGVTRPPVAQVTKSPAEDCNRVIFVTRFGLAVVGYVGTRAEVRHG